MTSESRQYIEMLRLLYEAIDISVSMGNDVTTKAIQDAMIATTDALDIDLDITVSNE